MDNPVDLLQIKIEAAKRELPLETINAINTVDWKMAILGLRTKRGFTFEQLGDLELETELLLCGLVSPRDYPRELEKRLKISGSAVSELVNEMNDLVFKKIRGELVKNTERKETFIRSEKDEDDTQILHSAGITMIEPSLPPTRTIDLRKEELVENREDLLKKIEKPEATPPREFPAPKAPTMIPTPPVIPSVKVEKVSTILTQRLGGSIQTPISKTDHSLGNLSSNNAPNAVSKVDPYRMPIE